MTATADDAGRALGDALAGASRSILVVTGAGISLASGIATFRGSDPGAVWATSVMEMATRACFARDPVGSWTWYLGRFAALVDKRPNPAHAALVELEAWQRARGGDILVVTQNIDCLHELAGTRRLVKVHGSSDRVRCASDGCRFGAPRGSLPRATVSFDAFASRPARETVPRCPECGDLLRPHVLWFDEHYGEHEDYHLETVLDAAGRAEVVMFVGTSFSVGITDLVVTVAGRRGARLVSIDPAARAPYAGVLALPAPAEQAIPAAIARLVAS